jgi:hypothetical protein
LCPRFGCWLSSPNLNDDSRWPRKPHSLIRDYQKAYFARARIAASYTASWDVTLVRLQSFNQVAGKEH